MKNLLKILVMVSVGICIGFRLNATELPVRYKSGSLNTTPRKNTSNWVSTIEVRYGQAETRDGFDFNGERTSALNIFGSTDLIRLGYGLENLTNALPQTNRYWTLGYDSVNNPLPAPRIAAGVFDNNATNPIKTTGRVSSSEFALNLEQNFFSGFFGQCYIPFRQLSVDKIGFEVIGNQNMPGGVGQVSAFVEQQLPTIMREQGIESLFSSYKKQAISEILLGCGWQGFNNQGFGIIDDASGRVFVGAIIPGAGSTDSSYLAGLPLGYDGFWGVHTRIELEVGVRKCLAFGASSSVNIFFTDTRTMRVMSDVEKKQSGFLSFAQARVGVDQGSVWDAAVFMKIHKVLNGLVAQAGYSFSRQEATRLTAKDNDYLKSAGVRYQAQVPPQFLNRDDILNTDQRLKSWERQMLHLMIGYNFSLHKPVPVVAPYIGFEFAYPVDGRRIMVGKYLGGTASLQIKMPF